MPDGQGKNAHGPGRRDDAALRSLSGAPPCGRKESRNDRRRTRRRRERDRRRGRGGAAVFESEDKETQQITPGLQGDNNLRERIDENESIRRDIGKLGKKVEM